MDLAVKVGVVQVRDMSLNEQDGKLVACSCNNSFVGVWVVELNKIKPFSCPAVRPTTPQTGKRYVFFVSLLGSSYIGRFANRRFATSKGGAFPPCLLWLMSKGACHKAYLRLI